MKKKMKIAIGVAVLVVLVVSAWFVLDSIFISDPRGAGGSSGGAEVATTPPSECCPGYWMKYAPATGSMDIMTVVHLA